MNSRNHYNYITISEKYSEFNFKAVDHLLVLPLFRGAFLGVFTFASLEVFTLTAVKYDDILKSLIIYASVLELADRHV